MLLCIKGLLFQDRIEQSLTFDIHDSPAMHNGQDNNVNEGKAPHDEWRHTVCKNLDTKSSVVCQAQKTDYFT